MYDFADIALEDPSLVEVVDNRKKLKFLKQFEVTTDSVVAKVHIELEKPARRISIDWGDFQSDSYNLLPGAITRAIGAGENSLPDGIYEFFHAYDEPEDRRPFERQILLRIVNADNRVELRQAPISLTPRYRITQYNAFVQLLKPVDATGSQAKIFVTMVVDGEDYRSWTWRPSNSFISPALWAQLPESIIMREVSFDEGPVRIGFDFVDDDWIWDDKGDLSTSISYLTETGTFETNVDDGGLRNHVRLRVDRHVELIRPLPQAGNLGSYNRVQA
ncbi:MAG: hypothetical protein AAFR33_00970 [Pseudomonadota bacterium]